MHFHLCLPVVISSLLLAFVILGAVRTIKRFIKYIPHPNVTCEIAVLCTSRIPNLKFWTLPILTNPYCERCAIGRYANAILFNFAFIIANTKKARNFEAGAPLEVYERIYGNKFRCKVKLLIWGNNRISVLTYLLCTFKSHGGEYWRI